MTTPDAAPRPIPVHITSANEGVIPGATPQELIKAHTRTIVITPANLYPTALGRDESRAYAILTALDNQVVLSDSWAEVQDPNNLVAGLPNPSGSILAVGIAVPVLGFNVMYLTAAAYPSRVSVIVGSKTKDVL
jgi:hypothetical protein